jgi:hypothetical protein
MTRRSVLFSAVAALVISAIVLLPQTGLGQGHSNCTPVGGAVMTNVGAIDGIYNLGPAWGDLGGAIAAKIVSVNSDGTFTVKHTWITENGDILNLSLSILKPAYPFPDNPAVVAVPWGHYSSDIKGGTGKFENATGHLEYFGILDLIKNTFVGRYKGYVCYAQFHPDRDTD